MRILVDTHIMIWHLEGDTNLSPAYRTIISEPGTTILISIVSIWEIALKSSLSKLTLSKPLKDIVNEIEHSTSSIFQISPAHALRVAELPFHHKDPFDRMIISQALVDDIPIITADPYFKDYGVKLL